MAKHCLDATQVRSCVQQVGCKAMAEFMGTYSKGYATQLQVLLQQLVNRLLGDPLEPDAEEQRPGGNRRRLPVALDGRQRRATDRNDPFLRAFAPDPQRAAKEIEVADVDPDQLGNSETARVKQLQDRGVAPGQPDLRQSGDCQ